MMQRLLSIYQELAKLARRAVRIRRNATLQVIALEERATPAADIIAAIDFPVIVNVAELPPDTSYLGLAPVKPIVRLDFVAGTQAAKVDPEWDQWIAALDGTDAERLFEHKKEAEEAEAPAATAELNLDELALTEEELAELMAERAA